MKLIKKDIWEKPADIIGITTNSLVINNNLVMGAGIALEARNKYPTLSLLAGKRIIGLEKNRGTYGWLVIDLGIQKIGLFQTKVLPNEKSTLNLIKYSTDRLLEYINNNPTENISLNFPGIGYGGLKKEEVLSIISVLPNNVTIYYF